MINYFSSTISRHLMVLGSWMQLLTACMIQARHLEMSPCAQLYCNRHFTDRMIDWLRKKKFQPCLNAAVAWCRSVGFFKWFKLTWCADLYSSSSLYLLPELISTSSTDFCSATQKHGVESKGKSILKIFSIGFQSAIAYSTLCCCIHLFCCLVMFFFLSCPRG